MKIALLTRLPNYYTEKRLAEEATNRGHSLDMVRYPACYVAITEKGTEMLYKGEKLDAYDAVISRSFAGSTSYGTAILRQLEVMGFYTINRSLAITRSVDTLRTLQILSREGVPIPKTIFVREPDQADQLIEYIGLPAVIRVASSSKSDTVVAENRRAISAMIQAFYVKDSTFLIQEYINNPESKSVRVIVVGSSVVASVRKSKRDTDDTASISSGKYDKIAILSDSAKKTAVKAARAVGLSMCSVDMIVTGDDAVVIGVDPYFGIENIEKVTGRNVAEKIIEYVELNAKRRNKKDRVGA